MIIFTHYSFAVGVTAHYTPLQLLCCRFLPFSPNEVHMGVFSCSRGKRLSFSLTVSIVILIQYVIVTPCYVNWKDEYTFHPDIRIRVFIRQSLQSDAVHSSDFSERLSLILKQHFKHSGSLKICRSVFYNPAVTIKNSEKYFTPSAKSNTSKQTEALSSTWWKVITIFFIFSPQCLPSIVNKTTQRSADDVCFPVLVITFSITFSLAAFVWLCWLAFIDSIWLWYSTCNHINRKMLPISPPSSDAIQRLPGILFQQWSN